MDFTKNIELTKEIVAIRKAIKKKQNVLHNSDYNAQETLNRKYQPLIDPIIEPIRDLTKYLKQPNIAHQVKKETEQSERKHETAKDTKQSGKLNQIIQKHIEFYLQQLSRKNPIIDSTRTGIRYHEDGYTLGNKAVRFVNDEIIIGGETYSGTPGLYQLLFLRKPERYLQNDLDRYVQIIEDTSLIRKDYNPLNEIQKSTGTKYMTIIAPQLVGTVVEEIYSTPKNSIIHTLSNENKKGEGERRVEDEWEQEEGGGEKTGGNLLEYVSNAPNYVYWDNVNELAQRLFLLHASKNAGNNIHYNEILRIEEELRESDVIY